MNIEDIKKNINKGVKEFDFTKKKIEKMIENAKKNGEEINNICDEMKEILLETHSYFESILDPESIVDLNYRLNMLDNHINGIKNIVGGK